MALGSPAMLALLALIPAAAVAWWWLWRARRLHRTAVGAAVEGSRAGAALSRLLLVLALVLIGVAAARPMWNPGEQTLGLPDVSLVVALDVSLSMSAEDVAEGQGQPVNRLSAAKAEIRRLIDGRRGDRIGLVIFAGDAFLRFPLTRDHEAALEVLEALQPGEALVPPGSGMGRAIELATAAILRGADDDTRVNGAIALVTDGEEHDRGTGSDAVEAAQAARDLGLQVFAVGVGSERGANIALPRSGALKIDPRSGEPIVTRLDAERLRALAEAGGGRYIELASPGAMSSMNADLAAFDLIREAVVVEASLDEQFQWFAGAAALALVLAAAARVFGWTLGRRRGLVSLGALVAALTLVGGCAGPGVEQANREGVIHYVAGEYREALEDWREAQRLARRTDAGVDPRLHLNAGRALHRLGELDRAETESLAALRSEDAGVRALAWLHTGNHRWANDDLLGARAAFIESLRESSSLLDAKVNLELVNSILESLEQDGTEDSDDAGDEPETSGQSGQSATPERTEQAQSEPESSEAATDAQGQGAPTALPGQAGGGPPTAPTFAEEESLTERREQALQELQAALDDLPLEDASLDQALAVLDAFRAVPGEPLAAGRLNLGEQGLDW